MFKKDSMWAGILLGVLVPLIAFGLLFGFNFLISEIFTNGYLVFTIPTLVVISICTNMIFLRYFMMKRQQDYIGRGIMLATFVYAFIYFFKFW